MTTRTPIADTFIDNLSQPDSYEQFEQKYEEINRPEVENPYFNTVETGEDESSIFEETIGQVAGGFIDGLNEMGTFLNWASGLDVNLPNVSVAGYDLIIDGQLNTTDAPETGIGGFIRGLSQFGVGLIPGLGVAKLAKLNNPLMRSLVAGGVADFSAFGANDPRLANFMREFGDLNDPITKWLSAPVGDEEQDNEFVGRLKNAVEGAGVGVAFEGIMQGFKWLKYGAHRTRRNIEESLLDEGETLPDEPLLKETTPEEEGFSHQIEDLFEKKEGLETQPEIFKSFTDAEIKEIKTREIDDVNWLDESPESIGRLLNGVTDDDGLKNTILALSKGYDDLLLKGRKDTGATETIIDKRTGKPRYEGGLTWETTKKRADEIIEKLAKDTGSDLKLINGLYRKMNGLTSEGRAVITLMEAGIKQYEELANYVRLKKVHPSVDNSDGFGLQRTYMLYQNAKARQVGINAQIKGIKSEWGRFGRMVQMKGFSQSAKEFEAKFFMDQVDPEGAIQREVERLHKIKDHPNKTRIMNEVAKGYAPTFIGKVGQSLRQIYINGLLSGIDSTVANSFGNGIALAFTSTEKRIARRLNDNLYKGDEAGMQAVEVAGMIQGFNKAYFIESWQMAKEAFRNDLPSDKSFVKQEFVQRNVITAENFADYINPSGLVGSFIDNLGHISRLPSRFLLSSDEFFRSLAYRSEQSAHAYTFARKASQGNEQRFHEAYKRIMGMTPDQMREFKDLEGIDIEAQRATLEAVFATPQSNPLIKTANRFREQFPLGLGQIYIPFFNTIMNILKFSGERTLGVNMLFKDSRDSLLSRNGLKSKQLAMAKLTTGSAMYGSAYMLADAGIITGSLPEDINLRRNVLEKGGTPYAFVTSNGYIPFNRLDPIGTMLGFGADMYNLGRIFNDPNYFTPQESEYVNSKYDVLKAQFVYQTMELMQDKAMLKGFAEIMSIFSGDPMNRKDAEKKLYNAYNPIVTFYSGFRGDLARGAKMIREQTGSADLLTSMYEDFYNRNPDIIEGLGIIPGIKPEGFKGKLYPKLNYVGQPVKSSTFGNTGSGRFFHMAQSIVSPVPKRPKEKSKLINKIVELGVKAQPPSLWKKIQLRGKFGTHTIALDNEQRYFWAKTAGDLNKEYLEPMISEPYFKKLPEGTQRAILQNALRKNREIAKQQLIARYPEIFRKQQEFKQLDIERLSRPSRTNPAFLN
tara:strand:- start:45 stop:3644 length:3600 start_codon:yes stop_codon:yes gene_type:complete